MRSLLESDCVFPCRQGASRLGSARHFVSSRRRTLRRTVGVRPTEQQERLAKWTGEFLDSRSWSPVCCLASRTRASNSSLAQLQSQNLESGNQPAKLSGLLDASSVPPFHSLQSLTESGPVLAESRTRYSLPGPRRWAMLTSPPCFCVPSCSPVEPRQLTRIAPVIPQGRLRCASVRCSRLTRLSGRR